MGDGFVLPVEPYELHRDGHDAPEEGMCINELVSLLAGESFTDMPKCACPVARRLTMRLNDRLDDGDRQLLRPFAIRMIGTAGDGREQERREMCRAWLLHEAFPVLIERAGDSEFADHLRALPADLTDAKLRAEMDAARRRAWELRSAARARLEKRIRAELDKRSVAVAVAAAAAVAIADAAARRWSAVYQAVRNAVRERAQEIAREVNAHLLPSALDLLDRMLPADPVVDLLAVPIEDARVICGIEESR